MNLAMARYFYREKRRSRDRSTKRASRGTHPPSWPPECGIMLDRCPCDTFNSRERILWNDRSMWDNVGDFRWSLVVMVDFPTDEAAAECIQHLSKCVDTRSNVSCRIYHQNRLVVPSLPDASVHPCFVAVLILPHYTSASRVRSWFEVPNPCVMYSTKRWSLFLPVDHQSAVSHLLYISQCVGALHLNVQPLNVLQHGRLPFHWNRIFAELWLPGTTGRYSSSDKVIQAIELFDPLNTL